MVCVWLTPNGERPRTVNQPRFQFQRRTKPAVRVALNAGLNHRPRHIAVCFPQPEDLFPGQFLHNLAAAPINRLVDKTTGLRVVLDHQPQVGRIGPAIGGNRFRR